MFSLNLLSDILMAVAFCVIPAFFIIAISRLERLSDRFKMASVLYSLGMVLIAASVVAPHFWPSITGTLYEFVIKVLATATVISASYVSWPFVRLATEYRRSMALLPETELLILERDDLEAAKTELEKEVVKRSYQLERVNRQMRLALLGSPITVFRQDLDLRYTWIFNVPGQTTEAEFIGKTDEDVFPPDVALTLGEVKKMAVETHEEQSAETYVRFPHGNFWYLLRTQPDYDEHNDIIGTLSCAIDITEQKRQQQRQHLLMREVTHRSKNLLAVLQSIVRQTARRTHSTEDFLVQLTARLQSIAQSHDLLVNDDWSGTSLRKLLDSQLNVLSDIAPDRVSVKGQDLLLTSVAVQNFGLAFHELAINAVKYGSLSGSDGRLAIEWKIVDGKPEDQLQFIWRESGGPAVELSKESGFGRTLLERVVGKALGGTVDMDFSSEGLVCTMALPVSRTIADWENETAEVPANHYATV